MLQTICIFCASSNQIAPEYYKTAESLADFCSKKHIHILFGGGATGLMGALANQTIKKHGRITGIIPQFMIENDWNHKNVENMVVVNDMRERKRRLIENTDAIVALPGGVGTLEELLEVITLKQLGKYNKPIYIFNTNNFYKPLFDMFEQMISQQFMRETDRNLWTIIQSMDEIK
jgi:uncharacterized protein (TIGR00730 family)